MHLFKVLLFQKPAMTLMIGRSVNSISIHLNFKLKIQRHPPKSSSLWDKSNSVINISYICFLPSEVWWSLPCFREPQFSQMGSYQRLESGFVSLHFASSSHSSSENLLFVVIVVNTESQLVKVQRKSNYRVFSSRWEICIICSSKWLRNHHGRKDRKIIRTRGSGGQ